MDLLLDFSHRTGARLAEVGFLLIVIAGVWIAVNEPREAQERAAPRMLVAGTLLAVAGVLLALATHYGHFGG